MDEIFVSWAMPDKALVDRVIDRLDALGMPVNEYSRRLVGGAGIRPYIVASIKKARMVVAIVSVDALDHSEWVREEITLAAARLDDADNRLDRLVLVRVGPVPDDRLPVILQADRLRFLAIPAAPAEAQLEDLIMELRRALGLAAPFVVPTALFAMTTAEFDGFRAAAGLDPQKMARLTKLCQSAGMARRPDLWDQLRDRYGDTAADFSPYGMGQAGTQRRLIDVAQEALRIVNDSRSRAQLRPIYLKWLFREDFDDYRIRDQWRLGHSVLVVDSLSALEPGVATALQNLPMPHAAQKAAVIYLPPYTGHNVELEELIRHCLDGQYFLTDTFRAWRDQAERPGLAFDLPTGTSLRRWLGQFLLALETALEPDQGNVSRMLQDRVARPAPVFSGMPGE
jgi:hypothetical protein